ncbi:hypothetical protein SHELI_v1c06530 [Spiroplasma helicoides]|uniref:Uncharacterized protein n=1 Tax=Spiroplasma helicoides TaxID=216938 RepID=A0A1B3SKZ5_9MOLU|nr:hypothetical protein [Spiroplasma helicoides]AOG60604.1 hypothetical protein SHELI_v1c06530 [Spiroplasma helicoides]
MKTLLNFLAITTTGLNTITLSINSQSCHIEGDLNRLNYVESINDKSFINEFLQINPELYDNGRSKIQKRLNINEKNFTLEEDYNCTKNLRLANNVYLDFLTIEGNVVSSFDIFKNNFIELKNIKEFEYSDDRDDFTQYIPTLYGQKGDKNIVINIFKFEFKNKIYIRENILTYSYNRIYFKKIALI